MANPSPGPPPQDPAADLKIPIVLENPSPSGPAVKESTSIRDKLRERASKGYVFDDCLRTYNPSQLQQKCDGQSKGKKYHVHGVNVLNRDNLDTFTASRRIERRREQHNRIERKRRDLINQYIKELTDLVVDGDDSAPSSAQATPTLTAGPTHTQGVQFKYENSGPDTSLPWSLAPSNNKLGRSDILRRTVERLRQLLQDNQTLQARVDALERDNARLSQAQLAPSPSHPTPRPPDSAPREPLPSLRTYFDPSKPLPTSANTTSLPPFVPPTFATPRAPGGPIATEKSHTSYRPYPLTPSALYSPALLPGPAPLPSAGLPPQGLFSPELMTPNRTHDAVTPPHTSPTLLSPPSRVLDHGPLRHSSGPLYPTLPPHPTQQTWYQPARKKSTAGASLYPPGGLLIPVLAPPSAQDDESSQLVYDNANPMDQLTRNEVYRTQ
ncbi:hypothetical protein H4R34_002279 [Dimargaris verticillata]|uniref:BHLH domain-containing protein n=1 Tax=Dimargaris verticillata TaxID=2761393 RepID=A0A9W8ED12_9FUNG|nr:hypothetical protein H4R34_002279 [Dimargaris verticillata]